MRTLMKKRSWLPKVAVEEHVEADESVLTVELDTPLSRVDEASNHLTAIVNDGVELESDSKRLNDLAGMVDALPEETVPQVVGIVKLATETFVDRWDVDVSKIAIESDSGKDAVMQSIRIGQEGIVETGKKWIAELIRRFLEFMKSVKEMGKALIDRTRKLKGALSAKLSKNKDVKLTLDVDKFNLSLLTVGSSDKFDIAALARHVSSMTPVSKVLAELSAFDADDETTEYKWMQYHTEVDVLGSKLSIKEQQVSEELAPSDVTVSNTTIDAKALQMLMSAAEAISNNVNKLERDNTVSKIENELKKLQSTARTGSHLHKLFIAKSVFADYYIKSLRRAYKEIDSIIRWAVGQDSNADSSESEGGTGLAKKYIKAVGGASNITSIDSCITRIRLMIKDTSLVDKGTIKQLSGKDVVILGAHNVQIIAGTESDAIANEMSKITKISFGAEAGKKDDGSILDDMPTMKKFVAKGDVGLIRQSFFMQMNDKRMDVAKLRELLKYLEKNVPDLFEELRVDAYSQEIEQNKSKWDRRMYHTMELYAVNNFAKARLNNMLDILEHIR